MRKIKLSMLIYKDGNKFRAVVHANNVKAVFTADDRMSAFKMGSSFAWERMSFFG